jgi:hypothetical protein
MRPSWIRNADPVLLVGWAIVAVVAVALNLGAYVRVLLAVPLVLFAPGYVLHETLFARTPKPRLDQLVIALGASIVVSIVLGLLMAALGIGLEPLSWTIGLAAITLVGSLLAWIRRREVPVDPAPASLPRIRRYEALAVVIAVGASLAIMIGTRFAVANQETAAPEQLWLLPARDGSLGAELGMRADGDGGRYAIRLTSEGVALEEFTVDLQPQETWQTSVSFTEEERRQPIVGRLYEESSDTELRFVVLQPPP